MVLCKRYHAEPLDPPGTLTIEMPQDGFTDESIMNLKKLVESKTTLIKKALGVDSLPIEVTDTTIQFPWFADDIEAEKLNAYTSFICALCEMAKKAVRVMGKDREIENKKYNFRCFLLRLGFVGDESKGVRKILLANLRGDGSFKDKENRRKCSETTVQEGGLKWKMTAY